METEGYRIPEDAVIPESAWEKEYNEQNRQGLAKQCVVFSDKEIRKMKAADQLTGRHHGKFKKDGRPRGNKTNSG